MRASLKRIFEILASNRLSCVLFLLLFLLTYLGTLNQVDEGLYLSQKKYFESFLLIHKAFGLVPIPLPGAYLVLIVFFVNLLAGGIIQASKGWSKIGILIAHAGILLLLLGAFISFQFAQSGHLMLNEGEKSDQFQSDVEWEIGVSESGAAGPVTEYIIEGKEFADLTPSESRTFRFAEVPFDLVLHGYLANCERRPAPKTPVRDMKDVNGFALDPLELKPDPESNMAGAYVTLVETAGGNKLEGLVYAAALKPFTAKVADKTWAIELRRRRFPLPFTVTLDKFTRELHPRTNMPREFKSDVTVTQNGSSQAHRISMNEPLRRQGFTFYQSSWGPANARPGDALYTVLAVSKNPAEQWPLYSCLIITFGLVVHFTLRLLGYLRMTSNGGR